MWPRSRTACAFARRPSFRRSGSTGPCSIWKCRATKCSFSRHRTDALRCAAGGGKANADFSVLLRRDDRLPDRAEMLLAEGRDHCWVAGTGHEAEDIAFDFECLPRRHRRARMRIAGLDEISPIALHRGFELLFVGAQAAGRREGEQELQFGAVL